MHAELSIISGATILGCEFSWVVFNEARLAVATLRKQLNNEKVRDTELTISPVTLELFDEGLNA